MKFARLLTLAVFSAATLTGVARADVPDNLAVARLLPGWRAADGNHMTAVRIDMAPGWKTYWRAPGDAGIPPLFDWSGSRNVADVIAHWPLPHVFTQNGLRSVGYAESVVIPLTVRPDTAGAAMDLAGRIEIGVCNDVCVPVSIDLAAVLGATTQPDPEIVAALQSVPVSATEGKVAGVTCTVEPVSDGVRLTARIAMPRLGEDEIAVLEMADPSIWISEAEMSRSGGTLVAVADMVPPNGQPFMVNRSDVRITVLAGDRGIDIRGCTGG